jgi:hypothetical protein
MRRALLTLATCLTVPLAAMATGCGQGDESTPVACLEGTDVYVAALRDAPAEVRLSGETPISDCLAGEQEGGDLAAVGLATLEAATRLNEEARADPGGAASLRLGYLLGAAERGAEETGGIHAELVRRLRAAALYSPGDEPLPPAFTRAYREGQRAGLASG